MRLAWPWLALFALMLISGVAYAQFNGCRPGFCPGGIGGSSGFGPSSGGGITPGSCSNSLDFSDGCNSQYLL
jgi:hypothetical protein